MALQVWLPLNGNLDNQGISDATFSIINNNTAANTAGKIGKCYYTTSFTAGGILSNKVIKLGQKQSMFCWFKIISLNSSSSLGGGLVSQHRYPSNCGMGITIKYVSTTTGYLSVNTGNGSSRTYNTYCGTTLLQAGTWYHGGYTYDGSELKIYVNGICEKTVNITGMSTPDDYLTVFCWSFSGTSGSSVYGAYIFNGFINDVRVYDHCLSAKEVKEISKGLVAHYKLSDPYISKTLVVNGFGELGTEGWSNSSLISTTEKPSADSTIKASTYNGNQTTVNILVNNATTYTVSAYIKSSGATSGTTYPSIFPIDADGKMIMTYNSADGFGTAYKTTLARPLRKGDTVIYATDLSAWTTANNNYYYHVAIFGYKDSSGRLYPDMGYTADSPVFGSYSDKSHIDKTNNTITLNAAFTGEDRPIGTTICQATEGSTYIYPFGGIALNTLSDWVFKSATLSGSSNRLKYAKYMRWYDYSNIYVAGLTIKDNSWSTTTVTDSSGFKYNGIVSGSVTNSIDTSRFSLSTVFNNSGHVILSAFNVTMNAFTINMWIKPKAMTTSQHFLFGTFTSWTGHGIGIWRDSGAPTRFNCLVKSDAASSYSNKPVYLTLDTWSMLTLLYNGTNIIAYINGSQYYTDNYGSNGTITNPNLMLCNSKYNSTAASENEEAYISDFRLYTTALSADDIKELYQASAHIDKSGNSYAYEFVEG